jgi:hypothetical protein
MDLIIIISVVSLLLLGALFVVPKSQNKGSSINICSSIPMIITIYAERIGSLTTSVL